jgi:hypothetical protein
MEQPPFWSYDLSLEQEQASFHIGWNRVEQETSFFGFPYSTGTALGTGT